MEIVITRKIAAPAAVVFRTVADIANWPRIASGIKSVEILSGERADVGTHFRETRRFFGGTASQDMYVAALDSPNRMLLAADSHGVHYLTEYVVEAVDGGASQLTVRFKATPATWMARMMSHFLGFMVPQVRHALERDAMDFAIAAERAPGYEPTAPKGAAGKKAR